MYLCHDSLFSAVFFFFLSVSEENPGENPHHGSRTQDAGYTLQVSGCRNTHGEVSVVSAVYTLLMLWR